MNVVSLLSRKHYMMISENFDKYLKLKQVTDQDLVMHNHPVITEKFHQYMNRYKGLNISFSSIGYKQILVI